MAYFPSKSTSSSKNTNTSKNSNSGSSSQGTSQKTTTQTSTDKRLQQSSKYVGSKYTSGKASTPTTAPSTTPIVSRPASSGYNPALHSGNIKTMQQVKAEQAALQAQQKTVTVQQQSENRPKTVFETKYLDQAPKVSPGGQSIYTPEKKGYVLSSGKFTTVKREAELDVAKQEIKRVPQKIGESVSRANVWSERIIGKMPTPKEATVSAGAGLVFGSSVIVPLGIASMVQKGSRVISTTLNERERAAIMQEKDYYKIYSAAEAKAAEGQPWYKVAASSAIPTYRPAFNLPGFDVAVKEQLVQRGYTPGTQRYEDLRRALIGERISSGFGEMSGILSTGALSELGGGINVAKGFASKAAKGVVFTEKTAFKEVFPVAAKRIAPLGAYEGGLTQELGYRATFKEQTAKQEALGVAFGAGFGAASAGIIGGLIPGTSFKYPRTSTALEYAVNIADITESPSDLLTRGFEKVGTKTGLFEVPVPRVSSVKSVVPDFAFGEKAPTLEVPGRIRGGVPTSVNINVLNENVENMVFGTSYGAGKKTASVVPPDFSLGDVKVTKYPKTSGLTPPTVTTTGGRGGGVTTSSLVPNIVSTPTPVPVSSLVNVPTFDVRVSPRVPVVPTVPISPFVPVPVSPNVPVTPQIPVNPFVNVPVTPTVPVEVPVPIPVNTNIPVDIPVWTPIMKAPLPILPTGGGWPTGWGAGARGKGLKYVSELSAGGTILKDLVGDWTGGVLPKGMMPKTKKKVKRRSKK